MRIGILSDTHDETRRTRVAVRLLCKAGAKALIHCGDLASPPIIAALAALPSWFVFGNHDADMTPRLHQAAVEHGAVCLGWAGMIEIEGKRIAVAHGHMHYDIRWALKERPHYLLSGHSHVASDRVEGLTRRINPGALHEADKFTVAMLDVETDDLQFITVPSE